MLSSLVESYIKAYAGKYLKNFSSEKVNVGLNSVKLVDVELDTEQLWKIKIPIKPKRAFIGEISADLSFVLGGKLEITVKDVLFLFDKGDYEDIEGDPQAILSSLQAIISMLYFTIDYPFVTAGIDPPSPPAFDVDSIHRVLDRLSLTIENVHFRIEELHTSYIPSLDDLMATGMQFTRLTIRSATAKELTSDPTFFLMQSKAQMMVINKVGVLEGLLTYCRRDRGLLDENDVSPLTLSSSFTRSTMISIDSNMEGVLLHPLTVHVKVSGAYDKQSLLLKPFRAHLSTPSEGGVTMSITDEQVSYLHHLVEFIKEYPYRMQSLARVILLSPLKLPTLPSHSRQRGAQLRWRLIKQSIRSDWLRYSLNLPLQGSPHPLGSGRCGGQGSGRGREKSTCSGIRWRSWLTIWALCGRYIAMREVLMYHVGYEQLPPQGPGSSPSVSYAARENLKLHYLSNTVSPEERANHGLSSVDCSDVDTALLIIDTIIEGSGSGSVFSAVLEIASGVIKALYALQLELDCLLPFKVSAFCRRRAEEKYHRRLSRLSLLKGSAAVSIMNGLYANHEHKQAVFIISVIEAINLNPTFAASAVHVNITAKALYPGNTTAVVLGESKVVIARLHANHTKSTFAQFNSSHNSTFLLPLPCDGSEEQQGLPGLPGLQLEVFDRSLFQLSIGKQVLSSVEGWHGSIADYRRLLRQGSGCESASLAVIESHDIPLSSSSSSSSAAATDGQQQPVTIRVVCSLIYGDAEHINRESKRFQLEIVDPMIRDRRPLLDRQFTLGTSNHNQEDDRGDDQQALFILDPSLLTVQDMRLSCAIPSVKLIISGQYAVPVAIRAQAFIIMSSASSLPLPRAVLVPLYSLTVHDIKAVLHAANNPLTAHGALCCAAIRLQSLAASRDDDSQLLLVQVPAVSMSFDIMQTSTMSRFLDGRLDHSCFDSRCTFSLSSSLSIRINSPMMIDLDAMLRDEDGHDLEISVEREQRQEEEEVVPIHSLWRSRRPLAHLWLPPASWAKVAGSGGGAQQTATGDHKRRREGSGGGVEAKQRLGDDYSLFPLHLNVIKAVSAWLSHRSSSNKTEENSDGGATSLSLKLPEQVLTIRCATLGRSLDCCLKLQPPPLYGSSTASVSLASSQSKSTAAAVVAASTSAAAVGSGTPQWLSWIIPPTAATATATTTSTSTTNATGASTRAAPVAGSASKAPTAAAASSTSNEAIMSSNWDNEKREMLSLLAELQQENQRLAAKLEAAEAKAAAMAGNLNL